MTAAQLKASGRTKHPGGRPSKKNPEVCRQIIEVVRSGLPLKFAAASVGVTYDALNIWRERDSEFSKELELARLASVKERWDLIQESARGNRDTPGDWKATAWSIERTWPQDFGRPEVQLNVLSNVQNVTHHNQFTINVAMAENINQRIREVEAEVSQLFEGRTPLPPARNQT